MGKRGVSVCPHSFIRPREAIQILEGYGMGMGRTGNLTVDLMYLQTRQYNVNRNILNLDRVLG